MIPDASASTARAASLAVMIPLGTIGSDVTERSHARYSQVFEAIRPGEFSKCANVAPAGRRKPIWGEVWLTPIGVFTRGTIALTPAASARAITPARASRSSQL